MKKAKKAKKIMLAQKILETYSVLSRQVNSINFSEPVEAVYNPLDYAWNGFESYVSKFIRGPVRAVFLGINPGPWGMAQTGVPFGEVEAVKRWLGLKNIRVSKPENEHMSYPVDGLDCRRSEVSGRRLWGLFEERFGCAENFFSGHLVLNYCPLLFIASGFKGSKSGKNLTPDKLKANERKELFAVCDKCLRSVIELLMPKYVVGVGNFAASRAVEAIGDLNMKVVKVLHPSPASPLSAKDWPGKATKQLVDSGVWKAEGGSDE